MLRLLALFFLTFLMIQQSGAESIQLDKITAPIIIGKSIEYFSLPAKNDITIPEAQNRADWNPSTVDVPNFGFSTDHYWFKFSVTPLATSNQFILDVNYALLDIVEVFILKNGILVDTMRSGNAVSFSDRKIKHRSLLFPLNFSAQENYEIYIHAYGEKSVQLPLTIWPVQSFWEHDQSYTLMQGLYYGIIAVMMLYNLFLFFSLKQRIYIYYVLMIGSIGFFQLALNGVGYAHLWTNYENWNRQSIAILIPACNASCGLFAYSFLKMRDLSKPLASLHAFLSKFSIVLVFFAAFCPPEYTVPLSTVLAFSSSLIVTILLFRFWAKDRSTMYFGIAWTGLLVGTQTIALNKLGIIPYNFLTENALQLGSAFESILLSLAMGEQIKQLQQDKVNAEQAEIYAREEALLLTQKEHEARSATKAKSDFLAAMSHEIRTPMNGVLGIAELLKDTELTKTQTDYIDIIYNSGKSLITIINDILDYSKIEAGKLSLEIISFDLDKLLEETLPLFFNKNENNGIQLIAIREQQVPNVLLGDPNRIKQILFNFIGNAFKFTESGFIVVRISCVKQDSDKVELKFEVQDTGIGMNEEQIERLFHQYAQADTSIARKYGGTGLGLTISKSLAELMGGTIGVSSKLGEGSSFWFSAVMTVATEAKQISNKTSAENLLLISNDPIATRFLPELFKSTGYTLEVLTDLLSVGMLDPSYFSSFDKTILYWAEEESKLNKFLPQLHHKLNGAPAYVITDISKEKIVGNPVVMSSPLHRNKLIHNLVKNQGSNFTPSAIAQHSSLACNVLVAEDNPVNQIVLKGFLKRNNVNYTFVEDGEKAVALFKSANMKFDLILMDCEMPVMDGYQATAHIRAWEAEKSLARTPIVALTAHAMQEYRDKARDADMDDYLTKPVDPIALELLLKRFSRSNAA